MRSIPVLALAMLGAALPARPTQSPAAGKASVQVEMHNVLYHFTPSISVHIVNLQGHLVSTEKQGIPIFDDANSFLLVIHSAEISITTDSLASALNEYVLASPDAPLKEIHITTRGDKLRIRGRLHSKGDVPFETEGSLAVTSEGEIRVHTEKLRAAHIPLKGLMDLLGETVAKMIDTRRIQGLRAEKDDLILVATELFPPPHIQGSLSAISVHENQIVQQFGTAVSLKAKISGNYMAYRGGQLRFGKITLSDTDLVLIDMNPSDPFDFYLDHYKDQLVAGYTKTTPSFGLRAYFRDYNKLPSAPTRRSRARTSPQQ
ncbi:MAG: hypothetical protein JO356_13315 [Acidobacteria bacterium]|nr:hypothetical protein [Acidobacteriota bacterium]